MFDADPADADLAACLSPRARLQAMLDVEVALAEAEASLGLIPASAVEPIRLAARVDEYDIGAVERGAREAGNLAIPLLQHLTRRVAAIDAQAASYVHWGATSQDTIDTGLVLQLRRAVPHVTAQLDRAMASAAGLAERHAETVMPGRTWLQQATPVTFGLKAAGWLDALARSRSRIAAAHAEASVLQFGGATGTLAALGARGLDVARAMAERLDLSVPAVPWHAHRDRLANLAAALGIAAGTVGKVARDLVLLAQTEVGEAHEARADGRGGSSTMPHKQNPVQAASALTGAMLAPGLVATMLAAMPQEHERGVGGWQAEWTALPDLLLASGRAARALADALDGLVIDADRMRANLATTRGMVMAESVTMALSAHVGRQAAHRLVERASHRAASERRPLEDVLLDDPAVSAHFDSATIARLLVPEHYLGSAREMIARVLETYRSREHEHA